MTLEQSIIERKDFYINYIKKLVWTIKNKNITNDTATDILMDAYLMVKDTFKGNSLPTTYLYSSIRYQLLDKNSYISKIYFNDNFTYIDNIDVIDEEEINDVVCESDIMFIITAITFRLNNATYWFDKEIFNLYYFSQITMKELTEKTKIPTTSIFSSIQNIKNMLNLSDFEEKCLKYNKKKQKN